MKKLLSVCILCIVSVLPVGATLLSPKEALARAMADDAIVERAEMQVPRRQYNLIRTVTSRIKGEAACYIFESPESGYMVLSADDMVAPILAYGNESIGSVDLPSNLRAWLDGYASQIEYIRENESKGLQYAKRHVPSIEFTPIEPLLKSKWNQGAPYNLLCPNNAPAGCVAVAIAQIMKYYSYPIKGKGSMGYDYRDDYYISFDFENHLFDWDNILEEYTSDIDNIDNPQNLAVANLLKALGVICRMDYKMDGSGSSHFKALLPMLKHLGFSPMARFEARDGYNYVEWVNLIYNELNTVGPVLMSATSSVMGGHEFVVDGCDENGYFHVNWGWGGIGNGYFLMSVMDYNHGEIKGDLLSGYYFDQTIVRNFRPAREGETKDPDFRLMLTDDFKINTQTLNPGSNVPFYMEFRVLANDSLKENETAVDFNFVDIESNESVGKSRTVLGKLAPGVFFQYDGSIELPASLQDGHKYKVEIKPCFRCGTSDEFCGDFITPSCFVDYSIIGVENGTATITNPISGVLPTATVKIERPIFAYENTYRDGKTEVTLTLNNRYESDFCGKVTVAMLDENFIIQYFLSKEKTLMYVPAGESVEYTISGKSNIKEGNYYVVTYVTTNGKDVIVAPIVPVNVHYQEALEYYPKNYGINAVISNEEKAKVDVRFDVGCFGYRSPNNIVIWLAVSDSVGQFVDGAGFGYLNLSKEMWEKVELQLIIDKSKVKVGDNYYLWTAFTEGDEGEQKWGYPQQFSFIDPSGIMDIHQGELEVVKTEYYNLQGIRMPDTNITGGHYIEVVTYSDGSRTTRHVLK